MHPAPSEPDRNEQAFAVALVRAVGLAMLVPIGLHLIQALLFPEQAAHWVFLGIATGVVILLALLLQRRLQRHLRKVHADQLSSAELFRASFEQAAVGMCHTGLDGLFLRVNRRLCAITGYDHDQLLALSLHTLIRPDDLAVDEPLARRLLTGEIASYSLEQRLAHRDGMLLWVTLTVTPIRGPSGAVEQLLYVVEEITDRKLAEWTLRQLNATLEERVAERTRDLALANDQLLTAITVRDQAERAKHESEQQYRTLLESLLQGVVVYQDERVVFGNQAMADILGIPVVELPSLSLAQLLTISVSDDRARILADVKHTLATHSHSALAPIRIIRRRDGATRWLNSVSRMISFAGRPALLMVLNDVTELKVAEERLRLSEARLHLLLANTPAVIFTSQAYGDYGTTFMSDSSRSVLGFEPTAFTDDPHFWLQRVHPDDVSGIFDGAASFFERGVHQLHYRFLHGDGSYRWLENGMSLLPATADHPAEIIGYMADISERKAVEVALRQSRDELRVANLELARAARLKDEFLANMSHELRTPLNAVLGRAELLREEIQGPLNARQLRSVISIEESGRHLLELINDILDLSKIEANKLDLQLEPLSVADLCLTSMRLVTEAAKKKQIGLRTDIDDRVGIIMGDARRLKQILLNLLSNAIKFTPAGGQVGLEVRGDSGAGSLAFCVWDTGIGIAAADLQRLFRPFEQLDSSLNRHYEGTGLGLSLVARLAKLHGGSVAVESEPGQGSRFTVTVPWTPHAYVPAPSIIP